MEVVGSSEDIPLEFVTRRGARRYLGVAFDCAVNLDPLRNGERQLDLRLVVHVVHGRFERYRRFRLVRGYSPAP